MSKPAIYNWDCETRGDSFPSRTFKPIKIDDVDIDLTDVDIRMQIRTSGGEILKTFIKGNGITLDGTNGFTVDRFKIKRYHGKAEYDIEFTFDDDIVKTWIKGKVEIIKDVTY